MQRRKSAPRRKTPTRRSRCLATRARDPLRRCNGVLGCVDVLHAAGASRAHGEPVEIPPRAVAVDHRHVSISKIEAGRLELEENALTVGLTGRRHVRQQAIIRASRSSRDDADDDALGGEPNRVRKVLFNLLGNASSYWRGASVRVLGTEPLGRAPESHDCSEHTVHDDAGPARPSVQPFAQATHRPHARRRHRPCSRLCAAREADEGHIAVERRQGAVRHSPLRSRGRGRVARGFAAHHTRGTAPARRDPLPPGERSQRRILMRRSS